MLKLKNQILTAKACRKERKNTSSNNSKASIGLQWEKICRIFEQVSSLTPRETSSIACETGLTKLQVQRWFNYYHSREKHSTTSEQNSSNKKYDSDKVLHYLKANHHLKVTVVSDSPNVGSSVLLSSHEAKLLASPTSFEEKPSTFLDNNTHEILSDTQVEILKKAYAEVQQVTNKEAAIIAIITDLQPAQVSKWFHDRKNKESSGHHVAQEVTNNTHQMYTRSRGLQNINAQPKSQFLKKNLKRRRQARLTMPRSNKYNKLKLVKQMGVESSKTPATVEPSQLTRTPQISKTGLSQRISTSQDAKSESLQKIASTIIKSKSDPDKKTVLQYRYLFTEYKLLSELSEERLENLSNHSGLTKSQIRNWFKNIDTRIKIYKRCPKKFTFLINSCDDQQREKLIHAYYGSRYYSNAYLTLFSERINLNLQIVKTWFSKARYYELIHGEKFKMQQTKVEDCSLTTIKEEPQHTPKIKLNSMEKQRELFVTSKSKAVQNRVTEIMKTSENRYKDSSNTKVETNLITSTATKTTLKVKQLNTLFCAFKKSRNLSLSRCSDLCTRLELKETQIRTWFKNLSHYIRQRDIKGLTEALQSFTYEQNIKLIECYTRSRYYSKEYCAQIAIDIDSNLRRVTDWFRNARYYELLSGEKFKIELSKDDLIAEDKLQLAWPQILRLKEEFQKDCVMTDLRATALATKYKIPASKIIVWFEHRQHLVWENSKKVVLNDESMNYEAENPEAEVSLPEYANVRSFSLRIPKIDQVGVLQTVASSTLEPKEKTIHKGLVFPGLPKIFPRLPKQQEMLFKEFKKSRLLTPVRLQNLCAQLNITENQISKWFQWIIYKVESISDKVMLDSYRNKNLTSEQVAKFEKVFNESAYPTKKQKTELAKQIRVGPGIVKRWFANRRYYDILMSLGNDTSISNDVSMKTEHHDVGIEPSDVLIKSDSEIAFNPVITSIASVFTNKDDTNRQVAAFKWLTEESDPLEINNKDALLFENEQSANIGPEEGMDIADPLEDNIDVHDNSLMECDPISPLAINDVNNPLAESGPTDLATNDNPLAESYSINSLAANNSLVESYSINSLVTNNSLAESNSVNSLATNDPLAESDSVNSLLLTTYDLFTESDSINSLATSEPLAEGDFVNSLTTNDPLAESDPINSTAINDLLGDPTNYPTSDHVNNLLVETTLHSINCAEEKLIEDRQRKFAISYGDSVDYSNSMDEKQTENDQNDDYQIIPEIEYNQITCNSGKYD